MQKNKPPLVITGICGFVGKHLAEQTSNLGFRVIGLDNSEYFDKNSNIEFHQIDISKDNFLHLIPQGAVVLHLASLSTDGACKENPQLAIDVNYSGTLNVIKNANLSNAKHLIFASSEWVYPEKPHVVNQIETDKLELESLYSFYAISKLVGETFVRTQSKVPYTNLRFGIVYGPRSTPGSSLESIALKVANDEEISVGSTLTSRRFVYIEDLVSGIIACINQSTESIINGPLNLAGNALVSLEDILLTANSILNKKNIMQNGSKQPSIRNPISTKAEELLNWHPKIALDLGIRNCLNAMIQVREQ